MFDAIQQLQQLQTRQKEKKDKTREAIEKSLQDIHKYQENLLVAKFDEAVDIQRKIESKTIALTKTTNFFDERLLKWNVEQNRFQSAAMGLNDFDTWLSSTERDLQAIAGNLEYVCSVLTKEFEEQKYSTG